MGWPYHWTFSKWDGRYSLSVPLLIPGKSFIKEMQGSFWPFPWFACAYTPHFQLMLEFHLGLLDQKPFSQKEANKDNIVIKLRRIFDTHRFYRENNIRRQKVFNARESIHSPSKMWACASRVATGHKIGCKGCVFLRRKNKEIQG